MATYNFSSLTLRGKTYVIYLITDVSFGGTLPDLAPFTEIGARKNEIEDVTGYSFPQTMSLTARESFGVNYPEGFWLKVILGGALIKLSIDGTERVYGEIDAKSISVDESYNNTSVFVRSISFDVVATWSLDSVTSETAIAALRARTDRPYVAVADYNYVDYTYTPGTSAYEQYAVVFIASGFLSNSIQSPIYRVDESAPRNIEWMVNSFSGIVGEWAMCLLVRRNEVTTTDPHWAWSEWRIITIIEYAGDDSTYSYEFTGKANEYGDDSLTIGSLLTSYNPVLLNVQQIVTTLFGLAVTGSLTVTTQYSNKNILFGNDAMGLSDTYIRIKETLCTGGRGARNGLVDDASFLDGNNLYWGNKFSTAHDILAALMSQLCFSVIASTSSTGATTVLIVQSCNTSSPISEPANIIASRITGRIVRSIRVANRGNDTIAKYEFPMGLQEYDLDRETDFSLSSDGQALYVNNGSELLQATEISVYNRDTASYTTYTTINDAIGNYEKNLCYGKPIILDREYLGIDENVVPLCRCNISIGGASRTFYAANVEKNDMENKMNITWIEE